MLQMYKKNHDWRHSYWLPFGSTNFLMTIVFLLTIPFVFPARASERSTPSIAAGMPASISQKQVSGEVRDADGNPLQGVTVLINGTSRGTATDASGRFQIEVNSGDVLVFRNVGFISQEVVIGSQQTIEVVLEEETADLQEVVVVGYGSQQKTDVTGSITSVSMTNVQGQSIASLDQGLSGQVAGVNVSTSNGTPGGGPKIQVRG